MEIIDEIGIFCIQNDLLEDYILYLQFSTRNFYKAIGLGDEYCWKRINLYISSERYKDFIYELFYSDLYDTIDELYMYHNRFTKIIILRQNLKLNMVFFDYKYVPTMKSLWYLVKDRFPKTQEPIVIISNNCLRSLLRQNKRYTLEGEWYDFICVLLSTGHCLPAHKVANLIIYLNK